MIAPAEQNSTKVAIGKRLREERERISPSQQDFAGQVGVSKTSQFNYETGERVPDAEYLAKAHQLGVDVAYVVTGDRKVLIEAKTVTSHEVEETKLLATVTTSVLELIERRELKLPPKTVAQLIELIYEHVAAQPTAPAAEEMQRTAQRYLRLVA